MTTQGRISKGMAILVMMVLGACGGGGSSAPPASTSPPPTGGITGTGAFVAFGTVTGFGSIIVNGIEYDTSAATFTIDGNPGFQDGLAVGDIVLVKGMIDDDSTIDLAESVEFDDNVEGPIATGSINTATGSLVVMGQQVIVDAETSFDDNISPASLDGLVDDDVVEISGYVKADGSIHATRIESKSPGGEFEITGTVTATPTTTTFEIGTLTVDFEFATSVRNFPGSRAVQTGDLVEAKGALDSATMTLDATSVEFKGDRLAGDDGDHVEVQGFITRFGSERDFDVSDETTVDCDTTNGCTVTTEGAPVGTLGLNIKVEVKGRYEGGVLVATSVDIRLGNAIRLTTQLLTDANATPDADGNSSLEMLGITIKFNGNRTRFEDKDGQATLEISNAGQLTMGDYVEIRGQEMLDQSTGLLTGDVFAVLVERDDLDTETIIQGFVQSVSDPDFVILDVEVQTDVNTEFREETGGSSNDISAADFFGTDRTGSLVKAKGTMVTPGTSTTPWILLAEEVEIQVE